MARLIKCQYCGVKDTVKEEMETEYVGKNKTPKRYHKHCYEEHLKEKEFKEKERRELDNLVEVIKNIYGFKKFPSTIYPYLQDLRNGTEFFGKKKQKYKEGYTYDVIAEGFDYCSETIEYWNARKTFNSDTARVRYGLAIVCDKLSIVEERRKQREEQQRQIERHVENVIEEDLIFESNYKKPSKHTDITDFLDD
ncbi:hypothetical protein NUG13_12175 [Bacillus subtilis]|uniref:Uncharacterized protein n=2 Tax=Zhangjivirus TaxID=3044867 RepID=A0AAE9K5W6_9CAUD|nr:MULTISPECIES: hypothetical protein [Bacillus subtilis group]YP_010681781.1 hypothetical protein PQE76_gp163 [Bacillus phage vB_BsuS_PJN02]YP_010740061.1 hypothetical protein P9294_gp044 [Bacillus phage FADO]UUG68130.1 hypothetical protein [Bacillus phage PK-3]MCR4362086.1 hypothetical protein [Bacillus subtilis]UNH58506.1 hypothetical protein [Bacillus phage vB_BsuS_PJN02]UNY48759.1 hypothetical protein fado_44 [Bacillus phage FADO]WOF32934.1 hypothetical protein OEJ84_22685 [Bacillus sub